MFSTRDSNSVIMSSVHRESYRLTEMHELSSKRRSFTCLKYVFSYNQGWPVNLKLFVVIQSCYMPSYTFLGSMIPELHDMCMFAYSRWLLPDGLQIQLSSR